MEGTFPALFGAEVAGPIALLVYLEQGRSTNLEASCPVSFGLLHLYGLFSVAILAVAAKQRHLISSSCLALCLVPAGDCYPLEVQLASLTGRWEGGALQTEWGT